MKKLNLLVVLINVDYIILNEGDTLIKLFIEKVLSNCPDIKFLMTSKQNMGKVGAFDEIVWDILPLTYKQSVNLFFEEAKSVSNTNKVCGKEKAEIEKERHPLFKSL